MTQVSFHISIIDDHVLEDEEFFIVDIDSVSVPNEVNIGNPDYTVVTILDNDGK